jgi:hypothetical protein
VGFSFLGLAIVSLGGTIVKKKRGQKNHWRETNGFSFWI